MRATEYVHPWCAYKHMTVTGRILYIGKGRLSRAGDLSPSRRSAYHLNAIKKHCGQFLIIAVAPFQTEAEAFEAERRWIADAKAAGHKLCNFTEGGEGAAGHVKSDEARAKLREAAIRQWDKQGRKPPKLTPSGVALCAQCGERIEWHGRIRTICSKRCASARHRKPYIKRERSPGASGVRGVYPSANGKWIAGCSVGGKYRHIGTFASKQEAAEAVGRHGD